MGAKFTRSGARVISEASLADIMNQPQYRIAWPPITKSLIGLVVGLFVLWIGSIHGAPLYGITADYLLLTREAVTSRYAVWSIFTYAFFHADFFGVFFTAIALWLFGGELQSRWSAARWWGVQLGAIVLGGALCFLGLWAFDSAQAVYGYQAAVMALVFSFCWLHWRSPLYFFFFAMTGRTMLLVFLGIGVALSAFAGQWPMIVLDLSGVAAGFLASTRTLHPRDLKTRFRLWKARRKLRVVRSPEDDKKPKRKNSDGMYIN